MINILILILRIKENKNASFCTSASAMHVVIVITWHLLRHLVEIWCICVVLIFPMAPFSNSIETWKGIDCSVGILFINALNKTAIIAQTIFSYALCWKKSLIFSFKCHLVLLLKYSNWQKIGIGLGFVLALNRRQANTWTNIGHESWRRVVSRGHSELN